MLPPELRTLRWLWRSCGRGRDRDRDPDKEGEAETETEDELVERPSALATALAGEQSDEEMERPMALENALARDQAQEHERPMASSLILPEDEEMERPTALAQTLAASAAAREQNRELNSPRGHGYWFDAEQDEEELQDSGANWDAESSNRLGGHVRRRGLRCRPAPTWTTYETSAACGFFVAFASLAIRDLFLPLAMLRRVQVKMNVQLRIVSAVLPILVAIWVFWVLILIMVRQASGAPPRVSARAVLQADMASGSARRYRRRSSYPTPACLGVRNPVVAERIRQLEERTRICTAAEWEDTVLPEISRLQGRPPDERPERVVVTTCCICLSEISRDSKVRGLACGHLFHLPCVAQWFMTDPSFSLCCPLCRLPLSEQESIPSAAASSCGTHSPDAGTVGEVRE